VILLVILLVLLRLIVCSTLFDNRVCDRAMALVDPLFSWAAGREQFTNTLIPDVSHWFYPSGIPSEGAQAPK
jgi:hypothetical protein